MDEVKLLLSKRASACTTDNKDYDNNLVKDNCSKETAAGPRAKGTEEAAQLCCSPYKGLLMSQQSSAHTAKKAVRRREYTGAQAAKLRYEEQMRFFRIAFRNER